MAEDLNSSVLELNNDTNITEEQKRIAEEGRLKEIEYLRDLPDDRTEYLKHKITIEEFRERKRKWDEVKLTYGDDPYFQMLFGFLDPLCALPFLDEETLEKAIDEFSEKETTQALARNPTHARLLRRLKDRKNEKTKSH